MSVTNIAANQIKFVALSKTATGDLVTAVPNYKIRVLGYALVASAAFSVNFESATTDISGVMSVAANGGVSYAGNLQAPAFETATGEKLAITLSGTGTVAGHISYYLVRDQTV